MGRKHAAIVNHTPIVREFSTFYSEWHDPIRRALAFAIGDVTTAEDATDEAMTRALSAWDKIQGYDKPEGWVYRVGLNWSRGLFRKRRYEVLTQIEVDQPLRDAPPPDLDLLRAVGNLSMRLRPVVVARYYLDWSTIDVAAALGIPEGTVKSRLSRALSQLASELEETP